MKTSTHPYAAGKPAVYAMPYVQAQTTGAAPRWEGGAVTHRLGQRSEFGPMTVLEKRSSASTGLPTGPEAFAARAERLVAELRGRTFTDSADLIRADRDRDGTAA